MRWEDKRREKLREYITVSFMMMGLILALPLIKVFLRNSLALPGMSEWGIFVFIICAITLFLGYFSDKVLHRAILVDTPNIHTYITSIVLLLLIAIIVLQTGGASSRVKALFFLPIIINAGQHGRMFGLKLTAVIAAFLVTIDLIGFQGVFPNLELEVDMINIAVMFLLSWLIGGFADVEKEVRKELAFFADEDELTELANHRSFQERLETEIRRAKEQQISLGLIMIDLDYFKFYNDTCGHQQGDEVLKQIGRLLKRTIPEDAFAARYGGEEFAVVLPGTSKGSALEIAENIRREIERFPFFGAAYLPKRKLTASLGVALFPLQAKNKEELLRLADQALYRAKCTSKNKVELYFSVLDEVCATVDESEHNLLTSVRTLIGVINAKDRYTFGHSERTVIYATELAKELGWQKEQINELRYGAFLHDIGKIEIDREILNKTGPLTEEEWALIKHHPIWGAEIVRPITSLVSLSEIIRHHHENFDGSGYPDRLKGNEIPIGARILRIVDSFDAMTTKRVYKSAAKSRQEAVEELLRGRGKYYDPELVDTFIKLVEKKNWGPAIL